MCSDFPNLSFHRYLGDDGIHPELLLNPFSSDPDARIYTMFDSVHIFKNIYFNLINKKELLCPPLTASGMPLQVHFSHLEQVHKLEYGAPAKMAHRLTDRVLHPSSVERVNVQLAVAATHESTIPALKFFGQRKELTAFNSTAEFLQIVRTWFNIANVKSPFTYNKQNAPILKPISVESMEGLA